jgi:hypothetical protein
LLAIHTIILEHLRSADRDIRSCSYLIYPLAFSPIIPNPFIVARHASRLLAFAAALIGGGRAQRQRTAPQERHRAPVAAAEPTQRGDRMNLVG